MLKMHGHSRSFIAFRDLAPVSASFNNHSGTSADQLLLRMEINPPAVLVDQAVAPITSAGRSCNCCFNLAIWLGPNRIVVMMQGRVFAPQYTARSERPSAHNGSTLQFVQACVLLSQTIIVGAFDNVLRQ